MSAYTLGLDIGSNSIGWALLDDENHHLVDAGVRVFPEGVDRDTKGTEMSKNAGRRTARSARRNRSRRAYRKDKLVRLMRRYGLLPMAPEELDRLLRLDPYALRAKGLDQQLSLFEFGRVLYHLNQRRGFLSNRKTGKPKDDGVVIKGASDLQRQIEEAGCRTLGEFFYQQRTQDEIRIRGHYTFRAMYQHEFDLLWDCQAKYHPQVLTDGLRTKVRDETIFFQRPLRSQTELIGNCDLEPEQPRCPRADFYARRFRILQDINNLIIHHADGAEATLDADQRLSVLADLLTHKEVKFDRLRKRLGLMETSTFNLEEGKGGKTKAALKGDEFASQVAKIVGRKRFASMTDADLSQLNELIIDATLSDQQVVDHLAETGFSIEEAEKLANISLPQGYMRFSRLAIEKLLPHMERGLKTHEAIHEVYEAKTPPPVRDRLGPPEDIRNPIVNKALWEVRKVVNAIIRQYGKPRRIAVEMARDVRGSRAEREELQQRMRDNQRRNEEARRALIEDHNLPNPSRDDIIKYKLWKECGQVCPYTGRPIPASALFGPYPEFQVEHILPYSKCLDDSYMNKTLCEVRENSVRKGQRTPYEAYHGSEQYEAIKQRVRVLPWPKRRRFLQETVELDKFIERQLNDTRYITRQVLAWLKTLGVHVYGTRGQVTAELRHQWGLDTVLGYIGPGLKNREDHRHHAVDAVVTALTRNEHLRVLAASKYNPTGAGFPPPWPGFREEVERCVNQINVSHRVTRKVSGRLHEETFYGPTGHKDNKGQDIFVYRKPLPELTGSMVAKIVDPVVRETIRQRLLDHGIDPDKTSGKPPKAVWDDPLFMPNPKGGKKTVIKSVRIADVFNNMVEFKDKSGNTYKAAKPGNNHHIEIFEYTDEKGRLKRGGDVVTLFEALRRSRGGWPVVHRDHGPGARFICSLSLNEMFMLRMDDGSFVLHRVQKLDQNGRIILRPHTHAGKLADSDQPPLIQRKSPNTLDGYKVAVDPLGRIHPASD